MSKAPVVKWTREQTPAPVFAAFGTITRCLPQFGAGGKFHQGKFGVLVAMSANPGHDYGAFRLGEDVRHWRIPPKVPPIYAGGGYRQGWDLLSGHRDRTIGHWTYKVPHHRIPRLRHAARLPRRNGARHAANRFRHLQTRQDESRS